MQLIDVHQHVIPDVYKNELARVGVLGSGENPWPVWSIPRQLELMDELGIDAVLLSIASPGAWFGDIDFTVRLVKTCNETMAQMVADHPRKFGAMSFVSLPDVEGGDIKLTPMGRRFADAELNERKEIFSRALMAHVPLAAHIRKVLDERASHSAPRTRFFDELEDHMAEDAAEETLKSVVSWARFAELFSYDDDAALFSLENPT